jgi:hypothetical protein
MLSRLETFAAPIIEKIIDLRSLSFMDVSEREVLSLFFAVQFTRTKLTRENHQRFHEMIAQKVTSMGFSVNDLEGYEPLDENKLVEVSVSTILRDSPSFAVHFMSKDWILHETTKGNPFYIGDNPVTLFNQNDFGPYGNLGLAVKGIQINFPLTPTLNLAFYCPSVMNEIVEGYGKYDPNVHWIPDDIKEKLVGVKNMIDNFKAGTPQKLLPDNVTHLNSLQVGYSDSFVFNHIEEFGLAKEMVENGKSTFGRLRTD